MHLFLAAAILCFQCLKVLPSYPHLHLYETIQNINLERLDSVMAIEDRSPQIIAVGILFLTLAWALTILRCYVRIYSTRLFRSDDWLALATLV
jgi:hypothetical protein